MDTRPFRPTQPEARARSARSMQHTDVSPAGAVTDMGDYVVWDHTVMDAVGAENSGLDALPGWGLEYHEGHVSVYGRSSRDEP